MQGSKILHTKITEWVQKKENAISIIEIATDQQITYQELLHAIASLQRLFGTPPKTIMSVIPGGIVDSVLWLTALIFGYHVIPVSPSSTEDELQRRFKGHTPDIFITEDAIPFASQTGKQFTHAYCREIIARGIQDKLSLQETTIDGTVYLETSGSTGKPKGMTLTATRVVITADHIRQRHALTEKDRGFTPLPFHHVNAPVVSLLSSILAGSTVIIAPKFSASRFWSWVEKYNPTWISIVPTILAILLKFDKPTFLDQSSLRFIRTASSPLPVANLKKFEEKFSIPVIETYGISEAGSTIAANPLPPAKHKPGSVGLPLCITMTIHDAKTKKELHSGHIGEVWVRGQQVISHYEQNAEAESFQEGWFRTGDLGYFDKDGYLFLTGRIKEMIIRGGENIAPREIEEVLMTYPGIDDVAVIGKPDPIYGEKVVAFITARHQDTEAIKAYAAGKLSSQKIPSEIHFLESLPRGKTGKIDKKTLRDLSDLP